MKAKAKDRGKQLAEQTVGKIDKPRNTAHKWLLSAFNCLIS